MKLRVLGAHAPYAPHGGACNGYLLETGGMRIMLDCGNGSFAQLQQYCDFRLLDALIITHYHPDHFHDYHCIRHAIAGSIRDKSRFKPLAVIAPAEGAPYTEMCEWDGVFAMWPLAEYLQQPRPLGEVGLFFLENIHTVKSYGCSFTQENTKIVYTSDTSWHAGLVDFAYEADLLVCEASVLNKDKQQAVEKGHLTAGEAGYLASSARVKQLVLTHLWPQTDPRLLLKEARENFDGEITLAGSGLSFLV
ncbi:MAG: MBL fold metallo-hydrolase [Clostridia bacterium]|jgi:ribonuclease BN (tRNA processing enzyme)|nr:MBL fold metallo-hydrolase [Clostridia bacterium]